MAVAILAAMFLVGWAAWNAGKQPVSGSAEVERINARVPDEAINLENSVRLMQNVILAGETTRWRKNNL